VIAYARREAARAALVSGLAQTRVLGVVTNLAFLQDVLAWPETIAASFHTRLIDERVGLAHGSQTSPEPSFALRCAAALVWLEQQRAATPDLGCWSDADRFTGWRLASSLESQPASQPSLRLRSGAAEWPVRFSPRAADGGWQVAVGEQVGRVALRPLDATRRLLHADGVALELTVAIDGPRIELAGPAGDATFECAPWVGGDALAQAPSGELAAPMMGKVVAIRAGPGDRVARGQTVIVLESMKMELHVDAPFDATVGRVRCALGDMVARGAVLADVDPAETT
jgi:3-methylcrotonyl-CoA carboxylase alpha subunit